MSINIDNFAADILNRNVDLAVLPAPSAILGGAGILNSTTSFFSLGDIALTSFAVLGRVPDPVQVYDQETSSEVFQDGITMRVSVNEEATLMSHPIEDDSSVSDFRVVQPSTIELNLMVGRENYQTAYGEIKQGFLKATKFQIQTKTNVYDNMIIGALPHEENAEQYNVIPIVVSFKEVKFAKSELIKISEDDARFAKHSDTKKAGRKQPFNVVRPVEFENGYIKNKDGIQ